MGSNQALDVACRDGVFVLRLRVTPKARRQGIAGVHNGALKVAVAAPPDKGKANEAVTRVLADALGIARGCIEVLAGHTSRDKQVGIRQYTGSIEDLTAKLLSETSQ